jgi:hypothetical protein
MSHDFQSAPGTAGVQPGAAGEILASLTVSTPDGSTYPATVHSGDTASTSDGQAIHTSVFDPYGSDYSAPHGNVGHFLHPNGGGAR